MHRFPTVVQYGIGFRHTPLLRLYHGFRLAHVHPTFRLRNNKSNSLVTFNHGLVSDIHTQFNNGVLLMNGRFLLQRDIQHFNGFQHLNGHDSARYGTRDRHGHGTRRFFYAVLRNIYSSLYKIITYFRPSRT